MENTKYKPTINQHEFTNMISAGVPFEKLEQFNVISSERIDLDWKGEDGKTLGHALFNDDRTKGFKIMRKHSGMDFPTCCSYIQSHWSFWRKHMDRLLTKEMEA